MILAIDPGTTESAYVLFNHARPVKHGKVGNADLLAGIGRGSENGGPFGMADVLVVEMIASYGMPVGKEVFETCVWIGRFVQAWQGPHALVYRRDVKLHLCNSARATDATIRQALIDRFGGKGKAVGTKASPGPLRGVSGDVWAALAVAVTFADTRDKTLAPMSLSTPRPMSENRQSVDNSVSPVDNCDDVAERAGV